MNTLCTDGRLIVTEMLATLPKSFLFILISFSAGTLCVIYIRSKDRFEKEPFLYMTAVTLWGGLWSYIISGILYERLAYWGVYELQNAWGALLVIGPAEELSKLAALASSYFIIRRQLNEPVDGLLYIACVALGYSLIENYYHALELAEGGTRHLIMRLLICTPMHINFSAFMGLAFYYFLQNESSYPLMILAFVYASLTHGIYDLIIFSGYLIIPLALVIWISYKVAVALLGYATAKSQFRYSAATYFADYPNPTLQKGYRCPACGSEVAKPTYHLFSKTIQRCDQCGLHLATPAGIRTIVHHFAAAPEKTFLGQPLMLDSSHANRTHRFPIFTNADHKVVGFDLAILNNLIEISNQQTVSWLESHGWFPRRWLRPRNPKSQST
jgi:RsiW-degrading membrane proteinase PrsW (M82 family)